jgi:hypothetical protein
MDYFKTAFIKIHPLIAYSRNYSLSRMIPQFQVQKSYLKFDFIIVLKKKMGFDCMFVNCCNVHIIESSTYLRQIEFIHIMAT